MWAKRAKALFAVIAGNINGARLRLQGVRCRTAYLNKGIGVTNGHAAGIGFK